MKKSSLFAALLCVASVFTACENEKFRTEVTPSSDTTIVIKGYEVIPALTHNWDSLKLTSVKDYMDSKLTIWRTQGGERIEKVYDNTEHPEVLMGSILAKENYAITADMVDITPSSSTVLRSKVTEKDGSVTEIDTVRYWFSDGQIWSIPVKVTNKQVTVGNAIFDFPSVTLVNHKFVHLKNTSKSSAKTRALVKTAEYQTEYKSMLSFKETNIESPKTLNAPIYAFTGRDEMSNDDLLKVAVENKNRVWIDTLTERCEFDRVSYYKSGQTLSEHKEIVLNHLFKGIDPYDKEVSSFDFKYVSNNGITEGKESTRESGKDNWTVWKKTDAYSANIQNGTEADNIVTDYSLMHERATYKDDSVEVVFDYEPVKVDEMQTSVTAAVSDRDGFNKAVEKNLISTSYLGGNQNLAELVNLYMVAKNVIGYEIINPEIKVYKDSVTADLDFVKKFSDGSVEKSHDHWCEPRTLTCTSNWESTQKILSQLTDTDVTVALSDSTKQEKGYWHWNNETRNLSNYAHLYDESAMQNTWVSKLPNKVSYVREGQSYSFDAIAYSVKENGASLSLRSDDDASFTLYDYSDVIEENYGGFAVTSTAPGVVKIAKNTISSYEIRNKVLTITNDSVMATCDFVTIFENGAEDVEKVGKNFARSIVCTTDWKSSEANTNEQTAQPSAVLSATQNKTDNEWSWVEQTRDISAIVTLNSTTQTNGWTAKDPNNIRFTRNGISGDFGNIAFSTAKANSTVSASGVEDVYNYDNTITVTFGDNVQNISAPGTITLLAGKKVTGHEFRDKSLVINNSNVTASAVFVTLYDDGSEDTENISKEFPRTLNPYTNWSANDTNSSVLTSAASITLTGSEGKTDGNWSYTAEKRNITTTAQLQSSNQTNGWNAQDPNSIKYTREGITADFGTVSFSAAEAGSTVKLASETATMTTYNYTDSVTVTFGDNVQTISAPGVINVAIPKTVTGYEITNQNMTVGKDGITTSLTFITKWSDGTTDKENVSKFFARNFRVITDWSSEEDNANQNTGSASVTLTSSEDKTDGDWSYAAEKRSISTTATLNGSSQNNGWESIDPNKIVFSRNGVSHDFGTLSFLANETGATVNKESEDDDATVYKYSDNISVTFGTNNFDSSAPGHITVAKPWIPDFDHGKFISCVFTASINEARNTWVYVASVHFENGTLPLIIRRDAASPEVNEDYFESNTDGRLNSASWIPASNKWINTIADDDSGMLRWYTTDLVSAGPMSYSTATAWGWNDGRTINGHPTVTTDKFSATISHNGYKLTIYKDGNVFATYRANM